jgi:hypothetical protein
MMKMGLTILKTTLKTVKLESNFHRMVLWIVESNQLATVEGEEKQIVLLDHRGGQTALCSRANFQKINSLVGHSEKILSHVKPKNTSIYDDFIQNCDYT